MPANPNPQLVVLGSAIGAAEIIRGLGGNPNTGMCRCPAHNDKTPSLHVSQKNGKLLVRCHAGCSQEAVITALKARNLWPQSQPKSTTRHGDDEYLAAKRQMAVMRKQALAEQAETEVSAEQRFRKALGILRAAASANAGKPSAYLKGRGIDIVPPGALLLPAIRTRSQRPSALLRIYRSLRRLRRFLHARHSPSGR